MKTKQERKVEAYEEYDKIGDTALNEYQKIKDTAWKEYKKKCKEIENKIKDKKVGCGEIIDFYQPRRTEVCGANNCFCEKCEEIDAEEETKCPTCGRSD